jgi:hypothetical protein
VFIEITPPPGTATVELFLGHDAVTDPSIMFGPPSTNASLANGRYYQGEGWTSIETEAIRADVHGSKLTYRLAPEHGGSDSLPTLLVVAYDGSGSAIADRVLRDVPLSAKASVVPISLVDANDVESGSGLERLQVWRRPGDKMAQQSACALVAHADNSVEFFVPIDDTDCDGAIPNTPNPECTTASEWNWCGVYGQPQGISEARCVTGADSGACRFAGPATCVDRGSDCPQTTCVPTSLPGCLPDSVCKNLTCNQLDQTCLGSALAAPNTTRMTCPVAMEPTAGFCAMALDPSNSPVLRGRQCASMFLFVLPPGTGGGSAVVADGVAYTLLQMGGTTCAMQLAVSGFNNGAPTTTTVLLGIDTGPAPNEVFMVPLDLVTASQAGCTPQPACMMTGSAFPCP